MKQSTIPSARAVVSACKSRNVQNIVISPGSRNAPLTLSFTEDPFFKCYSIVDERSAAFFALGMSQQQKMPVAIVCTSGSALLNYYPAIAEAFYSEIPLVVISADRPPYKIDVGDGQTIRQDFVFERHIGYSANLKLDITHAKDRIERYAKHLLNDKQSAIDLYNNNELAEAFGVAKTKRLPVHINVPFEEPLYDTRMFHASKALKPLIERPHDNSVSAIETFQEQWYSAKKKMVLVGVNYPNEIAQNVLNQLADDPSVLIFTETTSNLHHPNLFPSIDSLIFPIEKSQNSKTLFKELQPDILLTFGGLVVSKKVKAFLREYTPNQHWHISETRAFDTYFSLSHHFKTNANSFLKELLVAKSIAIASNYFERWNAVKNAYEVKRKEYLTKIDFSDFLAFHHISQTIPDYYQVHLANSSTVRYAQLFDSNPTLQVFCNRGTSGIDGSTSTAVGAAIYQKAPTLLITGDLSFFYDSNALWNDYIKNDFRIILINNGGGGIFRILPGNDDSANFEKYFETAQEQNAFHISQQYGFDYLKADSSPSLQMAMSQFYATANKPKILEIFTPRKINNKILLGYFDFIS